jgi:hypothetical protein
VKWLRFATLSVFIAAFGDDDLDRDMAVPQGSVRGTWLGLELELELGLGLGFGVVMVSVRMRAKFGVWDGVSVRVSDIVRVRVRVRGYNQCYRYCRIQGSKGYS